MIWVATPLLLATLGEMFTERGGVLNLGIEGVMLFGAMVGFTTAYFTGELWLGIAVAAVAGVGFGLLMGLLTVSLGLSQHVSGLGVTMLCTGLSFYLYRLIFGQPSQPPHVHLRDAGAPRPRRPAMARTGAVRPVRLVYLAFLLVPLAAFVLYHTPWGSVFGPSARTRTRRSRPA